MTQPKPLPPVALLRELFEYDPETGELTNKVRRSSRLPGSSAGTTRPDGYKLLGIDGKMHLSQEEAHQAYVRWHLSYFGEHSIYARDELSS